MSLRCTKAPCGVSCTRAGSRGQAAGGLDTVRTCHGTYISSLRGIFNHRHCRDRPAAGCPVAIAPGLPGRHVGLLRRCGVMAETAAGPAAYEPGKGHPAARPPAVPRHAFRAIFAAARCVLAARASRIEDQGKAGLVDAQQTIGGLSAYPGHRQLTIAGARPRATRACSIAATAASKASSVDV